MFDGISLNFVRTTLHKSYKRFKQVQEMVSLVTHDAVFRIRDSLGWIRILGSMLLTNGPGAGYFRHRPSRCHQKFNF
jgi:hypothetical protein